MRPVLDKLADIGAARIKSDNAGHAFAHLPCPARHAEMIKHNRITAFLDRRLSAQEIKPVVAEMGEHWVGGGEWNIGAIHPDDEAAMLRHLAPDGLGFPRIGAKMGRVMRRERFEIESFPPQPGEAGFKRMTLFRGHAEIIDDPIRVPGPAFAPGSDEKLMQAAGIARIGGGNIKERRVDHYGLGRSVKPGIFQLCQFVVGWRSDG